MHQNLHIPHFNKVTLCHGNGTHAVLQKYMAKILEESLDYINIQPKNILEIGGATGELNQYLKQRYASCAQIINIDLSHKILKQSQKLNPSIYHCCTSFDLIPFRQQTFDLIISNCTLQWSLNILHTLKEIQSKLSKDGLFLFSSFGPDTLKELKQACAAIDSILHINCYDIHNLGNDLLNVGFQDPVLERDYIQLIYATPLLAMKDLKQIGVQYTEFQELYLDKKKYFAFLQAYEKFKNDEQRFFSTFEMLFVTCWNKTVTKSNKNSIDVDQIEHWY